MQYRRLGRTGLRVSALSLGSWVTYHNQVDVKSAAEMMAAAFDAGVNFFDNAEGYAAGQSEQIMGAALKQLGWPRLNYVVSSKYFWGLDRGKPGAPRINGQDTLNRKYLHHAIEGSLRRMQRECIDLVFCHRPDPHTPIEETVWAMSDIIQQGKALYWGTSEWSADEIADMSHGDTAMSFRDRPRHLIGGRNIGGVGILRIVLGGEAKAHDGALGTDSDSTIDILHYERNHRSLTPLSHIEDTKKSAGVAND